MLTTILLQAQTAQEPGSGWQSLIMILLIFVVFYFFMIRPQSKKQKEIQKQRDAMQAGDRVITSGGIYGKVKDIKDDVVIIEIADNVRIKVAKSMIFVSPEDANTASQTAEKK
ncbi:MAG: preprotein translocase subunit YajC [Paludibacteraceae bacterium]|jgi:preprotein translocase subunit YajC|nr:preprotein translocase subunit YajC [Paludibacteraceae bacterium]MBO7723890.1 preprotein translocase subunit YajC [Paludibacteraceae bacterium]